MSSNNAELISESDAALHAKISASTLARFVEAGYFKVVLVDGTRCYPKAALSSVFGISFSEMPQASDQPDRGSSSSKDNVLTFRQKEASENVAISPANNETAQIEHPVSEISEPTIQESPLSTTKHENSTPQHSTSEFDANESFNRILKMHADILERQEREIADLKTERAWLKQRIEKLEEKAERDQILLLSESQTVKQLIHLQSQNKSLTRQALEWIGFIPASETPSDLKTQRNITDSNNSD